MPTDHEHDVNGSGGVRVLGLDPSLTSFGVCRFTLEGGYDTTTWGPNVKGPARLEWFWNKLMGEIQEFRPNMIMLEGYSYGSRGAAVVSMGELGGVIRLLMFMMGAAPVIVPPSKLKKFVTGKGNAPKDIVRLEAFKRFGIEAATTDEVEATCLAYMAAIGRYGLEIDLPKKNLEAFDDIEWPW